MPLGLTLATIGAGLKRAFRKPDKEGNMHDTGLMSLSKGLARTGMGMGIGMGATKWKQAQQLEQQQKMNQIQLEQAGQLQQMQLSGQKEMADYNQALGIDTWERTASPQARVNQYKDAGLNVGLMYGGSGGGGATAQAGGGVSGQSTQINPEVEAGMALQLAMNMERNQAEIENIKADTNNTKADTENIEQDTAVKAIIEQKGYAELNKINAETTNEQLKSEILEIEKKIKGIAAHVSEQTIEAQITEAAMKANKLHEEALKLQKENSVFADQYTRAARAAEIAMVQAVAETLAIQAGTEFKYGTQAQIIRWMGAATDLINSLYPKLNIKLDETEYKTESETKETPSGKKTTKTTTRKSK